MSSVSTAPPVSPMLERAGIVTLVLLLHAGLVWVWLAQPEQPKLVLNEMSVSVAMQQAETAKPQPNPPPKLRTEHAEKPLSKPVVREVAEAAPHAAQSAAAPPVVTASPAVTTRPAETATVANAPVVDTEPDYKASYLNNPRPAYPMAARRMGWQGRVILNVEVLSAGACGAVSVLHSSGHEVLDNAAMNTVKNWRFVPAKRAGRVVTQWFKVPIVFSFEDNEA